MTEQAAGAAAAQAQPGAVEEPKRGRGRPKGSVTGSRNRSRGAAGKNRGGSKNRAGAAVALEPPPAGAGSQVHAPAAHSSPASHGNGISWLPQTNFMFGASSWNPAVENWVQYRSRIGKLFDQALEGHHQYIDSSVQAMASTSSVS